ncbi:MAG: hypothetical protein AAGI88_21710 [Pseudomonadota bacterium]
MCTLPNRHTCLVLSLLVVGLSQPAFAGPGRTKLTPSISPEQYSELRYHTFISGDFSSRTDRFDLKSPVKVRVRLHGVDLQERGYAELLFTYAEEQRTDIDGLETSLSAREGSKEAYLRATLQTTETLKELDVNRKDLSSGVLADISGWPAIGKQRMYTELLIEEINLVDDGRTFSFHGESDEMVKYKDRDTVQPDEKVESPELSGGA